ncbi:MAG: helix-turn-helix transcriptional regulator [Clostridia bacterium]|nr:helix-turn-helix transcriptional regulator [Clostridia bacterium]MBQ5327824.1 helix-turn-helix transcriptional regulator [Oscillospiraceae bacterium]MBQ7837432.1 helix-turn-helix transcriptional regulator [Clostridia bacterium]MBR3994204.1 helix-turn-helix transcriptional regulator [Clostridia bacterium]
MGILNYFDYIALAENEHKRLLEIYPELEKLSRRELEVFAHLLTDKTQAQIAEELFITHSSVHFHCKNIYRKLGIKSRKQILIRYKDL